MPAIAVVDVETTGLFPSRHDRVIEIAVVVIRIDGQLEREFVTLVNPVRDIGQSSVHGLTSEDIIGAPQFPEIAATIIQVMDSVVAIAAHNIRFDRQFLEYEFGRMQCPLPESPYICTLRLAGGRKLRDCCCANGVPFDGKSHSALHDARAAARLLIKLLPDHPEVIQRLRSSAAIAWPVVPPATKQTCSRDQSLIRQAEQPTFLRELLARPRTTAVRGHAEGAAQAYSALLDQVLEDRQIEDWEANALLDTAEKWGLTSEEVCRVHCDYVHQLAEAAVADRNITDAERRGLKLVARLLGVELPDLTLLASKAAKQPCGTPALSTNPQSTFVGKRVCFTGELQCRYCDRPLSRELAEELASNAGLIVVRNVSRKLDILVVADPQSQSGKAKKAREYSVRILHEPVFWRYLGLEVT